MIFMTGWFTTSRAQQVAPSSPPGFSWLITLEAPDQVRALLESHLDIYRYRNRPEIDALALERLVENVRIDASRLLATEGYFSPQIETTQTTSATGQVVGIRVQPGEPARIAAVALDITGAIADDAEEATRITQSRKQWRLPVNARFRQSAWGEAKDALLNSLLLDGYPTARITDSEASVDPGAASVALQVQIDSGPLFHFGAVEITGLDRYPRVLVENLSAIRPGERYTHDALLRYQAVLQSSGYFRSASVSVDPVPGSATTVPIIVRVTEYPVMKIDLGLGYSTNTGPRSQASFTHYNAFRPGWQSQSKLKIESKQQSLDTELAFLPDPDGWRNRIGAEANRTDVQGLVTQRMGLSGSRAWRSPRMERDFTVKFQAEEQRIENARTDNLQALSLNYSWTLRRVDDLLRPKEGYLLNLQLGGAAESLLSTRSFARTYGRGVYILPLGQRDRLHLRAEAGAVWAEARDGIPNEFLFRTGGDQSLRGYAYQSLGVSEGSAIVGARYLAVASVEYQHDFTAEWGGAVFVDSGNATDKIADYHAVQGYGVGARWISPAGSLNFDIARANADGKIRFHFTIGARF